MRPVEQPKDTALERGGTRVKLPRGYPKELRGDRAGGLKGLVPGSLKGRIRRGIIAYGHATSAVRVLPDFIVVGAQRCGTSSLHACLAGHPGIAMTRLKEVRYFDIHHAFPASWYRGHFPPSAQMALAGRRAGTRAKAGEASPDYIFYPHVPGRVAQVVPEARLVAMLRDPVARAYSHYQHETALGWESRSPEEAFAAGRLEEVERAVARMEADPELLDHDFQHASYVPRGRYAEQLERWLEVFPREQLLIIASEELYADPPAVVRRVTDFLGLPNRELRSYPRRMSLRYPSMPDWLREQLVETYREPNRRLFDLLGHELDWS
jgi:Sulfotransferase domain